MTGAIDWEELGRRARRAAVARAPLAPVAVSFHPHGLGEPARTATWEGQVYGALAVCPVGEAPPGCEASPGEYQLIHVPTGLWMRAHRRPTPLRVLALALGECGIDWSAVGIRGLGGLPDAQREAGTAIVRAWGGIYGR